MPMDSIYKIRWDLLIMLLATYNCYAIPFDIAFEPIVFKKSGFVTLNATVDVFFFLDIVLSFRTSFLDDTTGLEVRNPK